MLLVCGHYTRKAKHCPLCCIVFSHTDVGSGASPQARSERSGVFALSLGAGGLSPAVMAVLPNAHKGLLI